MASNVRNYIDQTREEAAVRLADDAVDTALQTEIDQIETSVGLNSDGTFTPNAASNYIKLGTTIKYSLTLLDAQTKINADDIAGLGDTTALQTEINHIETGAGLNTDGTYSAPTGSNYINSSSSLKDADDKLDTQIKNNTTDIANEITDRTTAVGTVQSELNDTQTGAGLLSTGAYSANGAANYINMATSLKDADNKLDTIIKSIDGGLGSVSSSDKTTSHKDSTENRILKVGDFGLGLQFVETETNLDNYTQPGSFITPNSSLTNLPSGWTQQRYIVENLGGTSYMAQQLFGPGAIAYRWWNGTTFSSWSIIL